MSGVYMCVHVLVEVKSDSHYILFCEAVSLAGPGTHCLSETRWPGSLPASPLHIQEPQLS